jgi:hypothetical protein
MRLAIWAIVALILVGAVYYALVWIYGAALEIDEDELPNVYEGVQEIGTGFTGFLASIYQFMTRETNRKAYKNRKAQFKDVTKVQQKEAGGNEPQDSTSL